MPAEWERQARCWLAWPDRAPLWGDGLSAARDAYAAVARAIAAFEPVTMIADPASVAEASVKCGKGIEIMPLPIDDSWIRDNGPSFVVDGAGRVSGIDWGWNAWGRMYDDFRQDAAVAGAMLAGMGMRGTRVPMILEGGSIVGDGAGTVLTTEECLLNPSRNPDMDRDSIADALGRYLGTEKLIWLGRGLVDDDTDGHVDNVACFVGPGRVVALTTRDRDDANFDRLADNLARLKAATDAKGRSLDVLEIEQPAPRYLDGRRMPLSYINFCVVNGAVIVPQFDDPKDRQALSVIGDAFSGREIIPMLTTDICRGGGGIHCITLQQPAGPVLPAEDEETVR
ncbi:MAG: agmatine deiminase [Rhodospirillaceae bacterium]|nr:agmatine deiminase [Rhodospirillaceae bacterium]